jgi:hypothetical protein
MPSPELITELNAHWQASEGDYNAFEKRMRAAIAKAYSVPEKYLEPSPLNRILSGEFDVTARSAGSCGISGSAAGMRPLRCRASTGRASPKASDAASSKPASVTA